MVVFSPTSREGLDFIKAQGGLLGQVDLSQLPAGTDLSRLSRQAGIGGFNSIGGFSPGLTGLAGEIEQERLNMLERLKRVKANRGKSRISFPEIFPEATDITKDVI